MKRGPLAVQGRPQFSWGGKATAFWGRLVSWLEVSAKSRSVDAKLVDWFVSQLPPLWHGHDQDQQQFAATVGRWGRDRDLTDVSTLLESARRQLKHHSAEWSQTQAASYRKWLTCATQKGMQPLFRSVRKHEDSFDRPFRNRSLLDRVYHRWLQWHAIWCQDVSTDPDLFALLKSKAIEQARSLPPIPLQEASHYFGKFPLKSPGMDGWTPHMVRQLGGEAIQAILGLLSCM